MVELRTGRHEPLVRDPGPAGPLHRRRVAHDPRPLGLRARRERLQPEGQGGQPYRPRDPDGAPPPQLRPQAGVRRLQGRARRVRHRRVARSAAVAGRRRARGGGAARPHRVDARAHRRHDRAGGLAHRRRDRAGPHGADAAASPAPWAPAPGTLELPPIRASRGTADAREGGGRSAMRRPLRALVALAWHPDSRRSGGCEQVDVRGHAPRPAPARPAVPALGRCPRCRRQRLARSENQLQDPPLTGAIRRPVRWSPAAIVAACGAAVLLAAALMYALAQPEVLDKGSLLENADPVARVEVFERWTLYFDLEYERDRVSGDVVMSLLLAAVAAVSFLASAVGTRLGSTSRVEWFFVLLSLGGAVVVAAPLDAAGLRAVEELTELLGGALALAGTIALALDHLAALARDPQLSASVRR